jgi:hypothetical protein
VWAGRCAARRLGRPKVVAASGPPQGDCGTPAPPRWPALGPGAHSPGPVDPPGGHRRPGPAMWQHASTTTSVVVRPKRCPYDPSMADGARGSAWAGEGTGRHCCSQPPGAMPGGRPSSFRSRPGVRRPRTPGRSATRAELNPLPGLHPDPRSHHDLTCESTCAT